MAEALNHRASRPIGRARRLWWDTSQTLPVVLDYDWLFSEVAEVVRSNAKGVITGGVCSLRWPVGRPTKIAILTSCSSRLPMPMRLSGGVGSAGLAGMRPGSRAS